MYGGIFRKSNGLMAVSVPPYSIVGAAMVLFELCLAGEAALMQS
jgi:hypothetical protein